MTQLRESDPLSAGKSAQPRLLLLGLGNSILMDDGVGIHALRRLQSLAPRSCLAFEAGTAVLSAIPFLEDADKVIAFDAMQAGGEPGTVYLLSAEDVLNEEVRESLHEMGLPWALRTLRRPGPEVWVVAAEPGTIDYGLDLSPPLRVAVPIMVQTALVILEMWQGAAPSKGRLQGADILASLCRAGSHSPPDFSPGDHRPCL